LFGSYVSYSIGGGIPAPPCAGSATVPILPDDSPILPNLCIPVLLREGEAQIPGAVLIGGFVFPGGRGADHGKLGHGRFRLVLTYPTGNPTPRRGQGGQFRDRQSVRRSLRHRS
jgi:hypothetical protein